MYKTTANKVGSALSIISLIAFLTAILSIFLVIVADFPSGLNNILGAYFLIGFYGGFILSIVGFCMSQKGNRVAQLILMIIYIILVIISILAFALVLFAIASVVNGLGPLWDNLKAIIEMG